MNIGIEARALSHTQPGGFKSYTTHLINALLNEDGDNNYILYLDRPLENNEISEQGNISEVVIPRKGGWFSVPIREQVLLPLKLANQNPDVIHFPCATGSVLSTHPMVITIHDAIEFIEKPRFSRPLGASIYRIMMNKYNRSVTKSVAKQAKFIITDSEYSKFDILKWLNIPEWKIQVILISYAKHFRVCQDKNKIEAMKQRYNLPDSFNLGLISASPRKNAIGLLRIYSRLPISLRQKHPLVLVLTHPFLSETVRGEVERLRLTDCVHFLSSINDDDLVLLYNAAEIFLYPSLYEGFGLPVLEAMACGTPVIASNLTSIPEIAGNAAELANPNDEEAFSQVLIDVVSSPERKAKMINAGLKRAREFSWKRTAEKTLDVYRQAMAHSEAR